MAEDKRSKLEREADEYEEKEKAAGRMFDPKVLFERAQKLHVVDDPVLGLVKYGELTFDDSFELDSIKDATERTYAVVYRMLKKAYPDVTLEMVKKMPLFEANALMDVLLKPPFLSQKSPRGSAITRKRRKSA